jgi:hypothetical protein
MRFGALTGRFFLMAPGPALVAGLFFVALSARVPARAGSEGGGVRMTDLLLRLASEHRPGAAGFDDYERYRRRWIDCRTHL